MINIPFEKFIDLLLAPFVYQEMLWILVPLVISVALMEFYYGRYRHEELGWGTFFGNAIVLIFVALDLFRYLNSQGILGFTDFRNLLAIGILLEGIVMAVIGFLHMLPEGFAFSLGAKLPTSVITYMAIVLTYVPYKIDAWIVAFSVAIIIIITLVLSSLRKLIPSAEPEENYGEE